MKVVKEGKTENVSWRERERERDKNELKKKKRMTERR